MNTPFAAFTAALLAAFCLQAQAGDIPPPPGALQPSVTDAVHNSSSSSTVLDATRRAVEDLVNPLGPYMPPEMPQGQFAKPVIVTPIETCVRDDRPTLPQSIREIQRLLGLRF